MASTLSGLRIVEADLSAESHQAAIIHLVDMYARDPMGGGHPLPAPVKADLIRGLREHPTTLVFLGFAGDQPAGLAICFRGFSTFAAKPLINIHDFAVAPPFRNRGIAKALLEAIEAKARLLGCCKLTLEVLGDNEAAKRVYRAFGFNIGQGKETGGRYYFVSKAL